MTLGASLADIDLRGCRALAAHAFHQPFSELDDLEIWELSELADAARELIQAYARPHR